jgi:hypothetical protein
LPEIFEKHDPWIGRTKLIIKKPIHLFQIKSSS